MVHKVECLCSVTKLCPTLWDPCTIASQASTSFTISWSLLQLMSIELVKLFNHLILCSPFLLLLSIFPSIRVFCNVSALCIRWSKYWSFSFSASTSNEYSELISFRIDWFGLLAVQETPKSLLQYHNWKATILWGSGFYIIQLSHAYMTTGKIIVLTIWTFVSKVMCLFFNTLSRFVIAFSSKGQTSFNFMPAVAVHSDFAAQENKICHCFHCFPFICHKVMGADTMILVFWMLSFKPAFICEINISVEVS